MLTMVAVVLSFYFGIVLVSQGVGLVVKKN